jgi:hypothetical protein
VTALTPHTPKAVDAAFEAYSEEIGQHLQIYDTYLARRMLDHEVERLRKFAHEVQGWIDNIIPKEDE